MSDGVDQVGLSQPDAAVDEQRIIGAAGRIRHGLGSSMGELVARPDHKRAEDIFFFEVACPLFPRLALFFLRQPGRLLFLRLFGLNIEVDLHVIPLGDLFDHIGQGGPVVLFDPVTVKLARHLYLHPVAFQGNKLGLAKPGVVTLLGHSVFYQ